MGVAVDTKPVRRALRKLEADIVDVGRRPCRSQQKRVKVTNYNLPGNVADKAVPRSSKKKNCRAASASQPEEKTRESFGGAKVTFVAARQHGRAIIRAKKGLKFGI